MTTHSLLTKLVKRLLVGLGALVILLAVAVGGFRLLVSRLPAYQADVRAWVADELGLLVSFDQVDARWGLRGPELTLHDVRLGSAGEPIFSAVRAGITLDPFALLIEREPRVDRLSLDGVRLAVERTADGDYRLAGAPQRADGAGPDFAAFIPQEVEVTVRNSRLDYVDPARGQYWSFDDVTMNVTRNEQRLAIEARAVPPAEFASRVEVALNAEFDQTDPSGTLWRLFGDFREADLAVLSQFAPTTEVYAVAGSGDVVFWFDWNSERLLRANAELELRGVTLPNRVAGADPSFERIELIAEWNQDANRSWQLALSDVELLRNGRRWPAGNTTVALERADGAIQHVELRSDYLRLDDLMPIVLSFADAPLAQQWMELDPRGELREADFSLQRDSLDWDYSLAVRFADFGLSASADRPGFSGLSGTITSGARSGTVEFHSGDVSLDWPAMLAAPIGARALEGSLVWRQGRDVVRVVSNDLVVGIADGDVRSSLELSLPLDGSSPYLDMETTLAEADLVGAKRFLPVHKMPPLVVAWLNTAIQGGVARNLEFTFYGPIAAFPFDGGEGQMRVAADVEDARVEFVDGWPRAEELVGTIEFVNARFSAAGSGRILGNRSNDVRVDIADLRNAVLQYSGSTEGPLVDVVGFLHASPLIATHLGPGYERLRAHFGTGAVELTLSLPLLDLGAFELDGNVAISAGELSVDGFGPHATDINGVLAIDGKTVAATDIEATFLDGPVTASVVVPNEPGYRAALTVDGEVTADGVFGAFDLPFKELLAGQTRWRGRLLLPARDVAAAPPLRIDVQSNLTGVALKFPAPLAKTPSEPSNLQLGFVFPPGGGLEVGGNLGATRRFTLRYRTDADRFEFHRGAVAFGGIQPQLPEQDGITVLGSLSVLDLSEWLAVGRAAGTQRARPFFLGGELDVSEFSALGQHLGTTHLAVGRDDAAWTVGVTSKAIAGTISIPRSLAERPQITADMERVYLAGSGGADAGSVDPRTLPGLALHADEFGLGTRRFGRLDVDVSADPLGLRLASFASATNSFTVEGSGSWLQGPDGTETRIAMSMASNDVAEALDELGFGAFIEAETADVTASVYWPGPPSARWLDHINGDAAVRIDTGSLIDIDPGAGRVVGLLSIAALPRRLALDFRDVFNKGFVFDEIGGDFTIIDGNAYTDNLKLSGPGAEIGLVGRTGLRDRDYQQQAVVTAEPGNMLPTVGALVAGPGVGAAWLIFTRIFKEPLKGIGRAAYCVTGNWDAPEVERLSGDRVEQAEQCAVMPPADLAAAQR
jgi:uncharacterized protein (TIGR02099 family)